MEWNASTGLALGLVSTLTPWFFSVHSKLAAIAEQTAQGAQKIDAIAAAIPGACRATIPDAGHVASLENPDAFADAILKWSETAF